MTPQINCSIGINTMCFVLFLYKLVCFNKYGIIYLRNRDARNENHTILGNSIQEGEKSGS